jgi:hypothetical protein
MASQPPRPRPPRLGARFTLTASVERYPHFIAPLAATGTIIETEPDLIGLHLDRYLPGAESWNNDVVFSAEDDYDRTAPAAHPSAVRALYNHARSLEEPAIPARAQTPAEADAENFERDAREGVRLVPCGAPDTAPPSDLEVYLLGNGLGQVSYHEPQPGACGLAGASYWYALPRR